MLPNLTIFLLKNKITIGLISLLVLLAIAGFFGYQKLFAEKNVLLSEIDLNFDPEGPYAILSPRRDGNALLLNLKRTSSYDEITYELAYTSKVDETIVGGSFAPVKKITDEGDSFLAGSIDRGVVGTIDTKQKKGEYEQEILFGTCSKAVCKYDKGVENGTLTLKIKKGNTLYKMITQWHFQKPDVALGILTSGDNHFKYEVNAARVELAQIGYSIVNDLTGAPKLPLEKKVLGKVYALNAPSAREIPPGQVLVELAENPTDAGLFRFNEGENKWEGLDTLSLSKGQLSAKAPGAGIFAVLIPKK